MIFLQVWYFYSLFQQILRLVKPNKGACYSQLSMIPGISNTTSYPLIKAIADTYQCI